MPTTLLLSTYCYLQRTSHEHDQAVQEDVAAKDEAKAKKAEKVEKASKRKSVAAAEDFEMEDVGYDASDIYQEVKQEEEGE